MFRRMLRTALTASLVLTLWTVARPAFAMPAPLCDDRGASAIAVAPTLEADGGTVARTVSGSCGGDAAFLRVTIAPVHSGFTDHPSNDECARPLAGLHIVVPAGEVCSIARPSSRPLHGVTFRVERPPRA
jgi:hypothetical protein